jgi:D-beta-D-heptose 7-phosphate kinase/D-beta-D-heptose 1-phosphate adenosyltransferase
MKPLSASAARRLLSAMHGKRVLVVGDAMLDEFVWGKVARISPEAPVPVVEVTRESFHLGGACNVAGNLRDLGGEATVVGVVGRDAAGAKMRQALADAGIDDGLVDDETRPTTVKTRIIAHHQQVVRADRERAEDVDGALETEILARIRSALPGCRALILSDYQKGVLTPRLMKALLALARRARLPVLVDPKVRHFALYRGVALITPNLLEAERATGVRIRNDHDLERAGRGILKALGCGAALITQGEHGMSLFPKDARTVHIPTAAREVYDVTGAGDTVIATLGLALAAGASLTQSAALANYAAGVVVGKLGTATASPAEVLVAVERGARA